MSTALCYIVNIKETPLCINNYVYNSRIKQVVLSNYLTFTGGKDE